jgi:uncharacterized protein YbaR (Trm112 family)
LEDDKMFYYADCPACKKDLSHFATPENEGAFTCPYCRDRLKLVFQEFWDEEISCLCGLYFFEKA